MTLRIMGKSAPDTGVSAGAVVAVALENSKKLAALKSSAMPYLQLKHNTAYSMKKAAAGAQISLEELNKILSVIHRLIEQFSRLKQAPNEGSNALGHIIGNIIKSLPGKKVITLFDPRRSDEFFDKLWKNPAVTSEPAKLKTRAAEALGLLNGAEERVLYLIASKERVITAAAVEEQNTNAACKASLQHLRAICAGLGRS